MKLGMAVHTSNPSIHEVEAGGLPQIHASQNYIVETLFQRTKNQMSPNKITKMLW